MSDEAIENEVKIVLRDAPALESILDALFQEHRSPIRRQDIRQGYLEPSTRVRCTVEYTNYIECHLTYKKRFPDHRNLELEGVITQGAFDRAWPHTNEKLSKRRFKLRDALPWDIDFYRWKHPWFALAEVEMPADVDTYQIPEVIDSYVHFVVPREDGRFTARLLANEDHVFGLARELGLIPI